MADEQEPYKNTDALFDAMLQDELEDMHATQAKMSVREYARYKKIQPQLLYYYIRTNKLHEEHCSECGRKVIDVKKADEMFAAREARRRSDS